MYACIQIDVYIYIYIEREREKGVCVFVCVYLSDGDTHTFGFHPPCFAISLNFS